MTRSSLGTELLSAAGGKEPPRPDSWSSGCRGVLPRVHSTFLPDRLENPLWDWFLHQQTVAPQGGTHYRVRVRQRLQAHAIEWSDPPERRLVCPSLEYIGLSSSVGLGWVPRNRSADAGLDLGQIGQLF